MEEGKFVGSWQERESEQPLCFSGEGCQRRRKDKSLLKTCIVTKDLLRNNAFAEKSTVECPGHPGHHSSAFLTNVSSDVSS